MSGGIEFVDAGAGVSIQDLGRSGHRAIGVPLAGAADRLLLSCANALLAQEAHLAALEVALLGPSVRAVDAPVRLALVGDFAPRVARAEGRLQTIASWRSLTLQPGDILHCGPCRSGIGYLALAGGADVPPVLGSRSTYARAGLGGIDGRAPRVGDRLSCGCGSGPQRQAARPFVHAGGPLRVLPGPQETHFDAAAWDLFVGSDYRVTPDADRMGLRLEGPALRHRDGYSADIVSEGVVPGAVQVPGAGQPIVLGVDAQTIGGYAKIATVIAADLPRLAHARPGSLLRFRAVARAEALSARLEQATRWQDWLRGVALLRGDDEVDTTALQADNLISGMISAAPDASDHLPWN